MNFFICSDVYFNRTIYLLTFSIVQPLRSSFHAPTYRSAFLFHSQSIILLKLDYFVLLVTQQKSFLLQNWLCQLSFSIIDNLIIEYISLSLNLLHKFIITINSFSSPSSVIFCKITTLHLSNFELSFRSQSRYLSLTLTFYLHIYPSLIASLFVSE